MGLLVLLYVLVIGAWTWARYGEGQTAIFDLGIHTQATWLVAGGLNPFLSTRGLQVQADHFSPVVYFLAPFYWLWPDPRCLLALQTLWLASGAFPVYLLARRQLSGSFSLALAAVYLCQSCLLFINFFDVHFSSLLCTPLLWTCYALETGQRRLLGASLVMALTCSETAAVSVLALVPVAWARRGWRTAVAVTGLALLASQLSLAVIRWHNHGRSIQYSNLYSHYGRNGREVVTNLLTHPWQHVRDLNHRQNRVYLLEMAAPLAFLPLLGPLELTPALPVVAGNLLSWRDAQHSIRFHYMAGILPFLMWAAVAGLGRLRRRGVPPRVLLLVLGLGAIDGLWWSPLHPREWPEAASQQALALADLEQLVPAQASISLENGLGSHFSHRPNSYLFPNPIQRMAWGSRPQALVDQGGLGAEPLSCGAWRRALEACPVDCIAATPGWSFAFPLLRPDRTYLLGETCASGLYQLTYARHGVVLLQRGSASPRTPPRVMFPSEWDSYRWHLRYW